MSSSRIRLSPPDDLIAEILLRLPPDDPACLIRASLVCKPWRRILADPSFRRRFREFHRAPPMLGFLHSLYDYNDDYQGLYSFFVPTAAFGPSRPNRRDCYVLDARHGRVLFHPVSSDGEQSAELIIWDPITDAQWGVPFPGFWSSSSCYNAAVLCAVDGCDHLGCHGSPFLVAFVVTSREGITSASVYSSEAGAWSDNTSVMHLNAAVAMKPSVLVKNTLFFICNQNMRILRYDLGDQELSFIHPPLVYNGNIVLTALEDGMLGFTGLQKHGSGICLWSREVDADGAAAWALRRVINLEELLGACALFKADVFGFVDGVIFVGTYAGLFKIELDSGRVTKLSSRARIDFETPFIPYVTFCVPAMEAASAGQGPTMGVSSV